MLFAAALAVLLAAVTSAGTEAASGPVYRLAVVARGSDGVQRWTEWIDAASGAWRMEAAGSVRIFAGRSYVVDDGPAGVSIRTGSPGFLGTLRDLAVTRDAVRARTPARLQVGMILTFTRRQMRIRARVVERMSRAAADRRRVFAARAEPNERLTERPAGARPSIPVRAYWFGASAMGRDAVTSVEAVIRRTREQARIGISPQHEAVAYVTLYERPDARGASSAQPGTPPPADELQVVNVSVDSPGAQGAISAFNGRNDDLVYEPWPRFGVQLANGEPATVVPDQSEPADLRRPDVFAAFSVITATTLVSVTGVLTIEEIRELAQQLVPLS